eukprot:5908318-Prymnesium_polylepis.1
MARREMHRRAPTRPLPTPSGHQHWMLHGRLGTSAARETLAAAHDWSPLRSTPSPPLAKAAHQLMSKLSKGLRQPVGPAVISE